jgi:hypothetical protein
MTAHELARRLLAGPDVLVVYFDHVGYELETEVAAVEALEPVELWQAKYCKGDDWRNPVDYKPSERLPVRAVQALRLR